jgi:ribose 5-phosphate isomerase B
MSKLVFKRIIVGCDHAAFDMKNLVVKFLKNTFKDLEVFDAGVHSPDSVDYPDIASAVCQKIQKKEYGIVLQT